MSKSADFSMPSDLILYTKHSAVLVTSWIDSSAVAHALGVRGEFPPDESVIETWQEPGVTSYLLTTQGEPVAYVEMVERPGQLAVQLAHLLVDPLHRRKGFGSRLLALAADSALDRVDIAKVIIQIYGESRPALACCLRAGFEIAAANPVLTGLMLVKQGKRVT